MPVEKAMRSNSGRMSLARTILTLTCCHQLRDGKLSSTQTSTASSSINLQDQCLTRKTAHHEYDKNLPEEKASGTSSEFRLIDTPGHPKLRSQALSYLSMQNKAFMGVMFMLDSAVLSSQTVSTDTVEYLYEVLLVLQRKYSSSAGSSIASINLTPVLIACNKSDLFTALPSSKISILLQAELGRIKESRKNGLLNAGVDEDGGELEGDDILGDNVADQIKWEGLREFGLDVSVQAGSVRSNNIDSWTSWIATCLKDR